MVEKGRRVGATDVVDRLESPKRIGQTPGVGVDGGTTAVRSRCLEQ